MKMRRLFHPCFFLFMLLIVSCSAQVHPTGEPAITASTTAPPVPSATASPGVTVNQTRTADWALFQSTLAALKTQVAVLQSQTPTPTRTRVPPTATVYVTPRPTTPGEAKFVGQTVPIVHNSLDRTWFWRIEDAPEKNYQVTHIISADGTREFFVHPEEGEIELSAAHYTPYYWLPNGKYVYMVGNGCCIDRPPTHYWTEKLVRFDLETGQISTVLPWVGYSFSTSYGYSVGFSPDGKYLVWSEGWKPMVHIIELRSGNETLASVDKQLDDFGILNYDKPSDGWSPDRKKVILETYYSYHPSSEDYFVNAAFVVVSAETGKTQMIQDDITERIDIFLDNSYRIKWLDDTHIQLIVGDAQKTFQVNLP